MDDMLNKYQYDAQKNSELLWIKNEQIKNLHADGHIIGMHSHTHPTVMINKTFDEQMQEYGENQEILQSITGGKIFSISYPCNSYNQDTLRCMRKLDIEIGFRANMNADRVGGADDKRLECPREDHANIMYEIRNKK